MTRGRRGSLLLRREALSSSPLCRFIPALYASADGGKSFTAAPLLVGPSNAYLTGVESARAAPATVYVSMFTDAPSLLRSTDGGANFTRFDVGAATRAALYIAAVDTVDASRLYLRATTSPGESLAISDDGGVTLRLPLTLSSIMTAFLRRADGTLLVGASDGSGHRSKDGGQSFTPWTTPHLRGLAERGPALYAATSDLLDGFAVAVTTDEGGSWRPLLRLRDIQGPAACVAAVCAGPWEMVQAALGVGGDGGAPPDLAPAAARPSGCRCSFGGGGDGSGATPLVLALVATGWRRRRRASG
jgi:MYXO-CTERM domain-containing protein